MENWSCLRFRASALMAATTFLFGAIVLMKLWILMMSPHSPPAPTPPQPPSSPQYKTQCVPPTPHPTPPRHSRCHPDSRFAQTPCPSFFFVQTWLQLQPMTCQLSPAY